MSVIIDSINDSKETVKDYTLVTNSWLEFVDYGWENQDRLYTFLQLVNLIDEDISVRFKADAVGDVTSEFLCPALTSRSIPLIHKGLIEWKLDTATTASEGRFILLSI
jgi:hypothetical protein